MAGDELARRGWHLSEDGLQQCSENGKKSTDQIVKVALDTDLKEIGEKWLPEELSRGRLDYLQGPAVLQVQKLRNIAAPKENENSQTAPRLLKVTLTDGHMTCVGIETENLKNISLGTAPGSKILLDGTVDVEHSFLLLSNKNFKFLGGRVDQIAENWEFKMKLAKQNRSNVQSEGGPPLFVPFGKKIQHVVTDIKKEKKENFKSLAVSKEKIETTEFDHQRQATIAEALQAKEGGKVKTFGSKVPVNDKDVARIVEMGFSSDQAVDALRQCSGDVTAATHCLLAVDDGGGGSERYNRGGGRFERNDRGYGNDRSDRGQSYGNDRSDRGQSYGNDRTDRGQSYGNDRTDRGQGYGNDRSDRGQGYGNDRSDRGQGYGNDRSDRGQGYGNDRSDRGQGGGYGNRGERSDRYQRGERADRFERDRGDKYERGDRADRFDKNDRGDRLQGGRFDKGERTERRDHKQGGRGRRGRDEEPDDGGSCRPSGPTTLFDFLTTKIPVKENKTNGTSENSNVSSNKGYTAEHKNPTSYSSSSSFSSKSSNYSEDVSSHNPPNRKPSLPPRFANKPSRETNPRKEDYSNKQYSDQPNRTGSSQSHYSNSSSEAQDRVQSSSSNKPESGSVRKTTDRNQTRPSTNVVQHGPPNSSRRNVQQEDRSQDGRQQDRYGDRDRQAKGRDRQNNLRDGQMDGQTDNPKWTNSSGRINQNDGQESWSRDVGQMWKEGDVCLAKYWEDNRFYPSRIEAMAPQVGTCVVTFLEYGNAEEVLLSDIRPIGKQPWQPNGPQDNYGNFYNAARNPHSQNYFVPPPQVPISNPPPFMGEDVLNSGGSIGTLEFRRGGSGPYDRGHANPKGRPTQKLYQPPPVFQSRHSTS